MGKTVEELIEQMDKVTPKYVATLSREEILKLIKECVKKDTFNILRPIKSDKYIKYWAAITYYDPRLCEALKESSSKWYMMVCEEIKEYIQKRSLSNTEIARYYKENF